MVDLNFGDDYVILMMLMLVFIMIIDGVRTGTEEEREHS
jgi:hypothetical protein